MTWLGQNKSAAQSAKEQAEHAELLKQYMAQTQNWPTPISPRPDRRQRPIREWNHTNIPQLLDLIALLQAAKKGGQKVCGTHRFELSDLDLGVEVSADKLADSTISDIPSLVEFLQTEYAIQKIRG